MIYLGLTPEQKRQTVLKYISEHSEITNVVVISPPEFDFEYNHDWKIETYEHSDFYVFFYPAVAETDEHRLVVLNECMRTKNRYDLIYNCLHHWISQTPHRIVFEYFPFIDDESDYMILADLDKPYRFKGIGYSHNIVAETSPSGQAVHLRLKTLTVNLPENAVEKYEHERDRLFDNLGNKDPETVPRQLHIWAGRYKKPLDENEYVARNARFKKPNVHTFSENKHGVLLDIPHAQKDFNDWMKQTKQTDLTFVSSGLKVDQFYENRTKGFIARLEAWYAEAGL